MCSYGPDGYRARWDWDYAKNRRNQQKHGLGFETAQLVFADPLALSCPDPHPDEQRWQTVGLIGPVVVLVVHTSAALEPETGEVRGRIIQRAEGHET